MKSKDSENIRTEKGYLVHKILRDHFQIEDSRLRKLRYSNEFNKFFLYIYSKEEIAQELCFNFREIEEMIQLFISVSTHLLKKFDSFFNAQKPIAIDTNATADTTAEPS